MTSSSSAAHLLDAFLSMSIVSGTLLLIGQNLIGFVYLFKFGFVAVLLIWVVLYGRLAKRFFNFIFAGSFINA